MAVLLHKTALVHFPMATIVPNKSSFRDFLTVYKGPKQSRGFIKSLEIFSCVLIIYVNINAQFQLFGNLLRT